MKEMYNLTQLATEALNNLNAIGIYPHVTPSDFTVNTRATQRYGQARKRVKNGKVVYSINISSFLLDKRNDEKSVMTTIYHEAIHCCDDCMCHTGKWKELAELVSDCYNVDITRCSSFSDKLNENVLQEHKEKIQKRREDNTYRYTCLCRACGVKSTRIMKRAPKWYTHTENFECSRCHSKQLNVWREPTFN
jgi:hypothetical protein